MLIGVPKEIKDHEFFREINWELMAEKKVQPLFKPKIDSEVDLSNIDRAFTREDPKETPSDPALRKHLLTEKFD